VGKGKDVSDFYEVGKKYLVQADYRWLKTENSNGAFGYNFEGALQEYVLLDERVITSPDGESMLIPASDELSDSAVTLVEPWACVEDAYVSKERRTVKSGGKMLIATDTEIDTDTLKTFLDKSPNPSEVTFCGIKSVSVQGCDTKTVNDISSLAGTKFDDIIYFGTDINTVEKLFDLLDAKGVINFVQCGGEFGETVKVPVGRTHYGGIRIIGTPGGNPAEAYDYIPENGEIRKGDKINIVGAAGPMGLMHTVRNLCQGIEDVSIFASDIDDERLEALAKTAKPIADENGLEYVSRNPKRDKINEKFDYTALMVPSPQFVASAVGTSNPEAIINIFAGIPADVQADIDLDTYIKNRIYFIGTSGSTLEDMKIVLNKVESGRLDTSVSVAAVSDLKSAVEGIRAVENRSVAGKIIVFPKCKGMGMLSLEQLSEKFPEVGEKLNNGIWTKQAETELLKNYESENTN
jgi:D-arabinose 1-dehydrogenase-like Zn-dependent alcohol dehydrogenase